MTSEAPLPVLAVVRPATGGIRQHILSQMRFAQTVDLDLTIAAPSEFLRGLPPDLPPFPSFPLEIKPRFSLLEDVAAAGRLRTFLQSYDGLVHAHGLRAAWIAALAHALEPFPLVVTLHNLVPSGLAARMGLSLIAGQAARVLCVSQAISDGAALAGVPSEKLQVVPNGIVLDDYVFSPEPDRTGWDFGAEPFVVAAIGRLSPEKGFDLLLQAAQSLPEVRFLIAGDGPERAALEKVALTNVSLLGRVADIRPVLAAANIVAVPSRQEGQGIVALEALASGKPLVAAEVGGLAEMLTDAETALFFPRDDVPALVLAISRLQNDPALRAHLSALGRDLVQCNYALMPLLVRLRQIYREVMPAPPAA